MKEIIAIVYSDIHHNLWTTFNNYTDSRLKDSIGVQSDIHSDSKRLGSVPILFAGDLMHKEKLIENKLLNYLLPHFNKIWNDGTITYAISGNHDQSEENTTRHSSPSFVKAFSYIFKGLECIDFKSVEIHKNIILHGIPYLTHDEGLYEYLESLKLTKGKKHILMLHTTIPGSKDTDGRVMETSTIKYKIKKLFKRFDLVLTGHIHMPMELSNNMYQVGATNHQRKTDAKCKLGYWYIYDDLTLKFKESMAPKFIKIGIDDIVKDNLHHYFKDTQEVTNVTIDKEDDKKFADINNRTKLGISYCDAIGEKDKVKVTALIQTLKKVE